MSDNERDLTGEDVARIAHALVAVADRNLNPSLRTVVLVFDRKSAHLGVATNAGEDGALAILRSALDGRGRVDVDVERGHDA